VRDHGREPRGVVRQRPEVRQRLLLGLGPALDDVHVRAVAPLARELEPDAVRVEEVDRVRLGPDVDRAEVRDAGALEPRAPLGFAPLGISKNATSESPPASKK
jgi:hypothetical protein